MHSMMVCEFKTCQPFDPNLLRGHSVHQSHFCAWSWIARGSQHTVCTSTPWLHLTALFPCVQDHRHCKTAQQTISRCGRLKNSYFFCQFSCRFTIQVHTPLCKSNGGGDMVTRTSGLGIWTKEPLPLWILLAWHRNKSLKLSIYCFQAPLVPKILLCTNKGMQ